MKRKTKPVFQDKPCAKCGNTFTPKSGNCPMCDDCRNKAVNQQQPDNNKDMYVFERHIREYNKKHGTDYTYGQYTQLLSAGKLISDKS